MVTWCGENPTWCKSDGLQISSRSARPDVPEFRRLDRYRQNKTWLIDYLGLFWLKNQGENDKIGVMRGRLAVGRGPLEAVALVRIQPPQLNFIPCPGEKPIFPNSKTF